MKNQSDKDGRPGLRLRESRSGLGDRREKRGGRKVRVVRGPARDNAPRNANIRLLPQPRPVGEVSDHDLDAAAPVFVMGPGVLVDCCILMQS